MNLRTWPYWLSIVNVALGGVAFIVGAALANPGLRVSGTVWGVCGIAIGAVASLMGPSPAPEKGNR
jgi:hypothetical protein